MSNELTSGDEITMTEFASRREDVYLVAATGGVVYLTRNGRRRMAVVPASVAEEYYRAKGLRYGDDLQQ